ncbi:MAG: 16S rRNA (cytosine(1402)-N(4))-methyltransferase RsmH [bacterium]
MADNTHKNDKNIEKPYHKSVLIQEVLTYLDPKPNKLYIDATFGGGGHTKAILDHEPNCHVIALDWDTQAIEHNAQSLTNQYGDRLKILWGNFALIHQLLKKENISNFDGILADFGTSQHQLFEKEGFSFNIDSPLDMRMSTAHQKTTARNIVNLYTEKQLAQILFDYADEFHSRKIAKAILEYRSKKSITTTKELAQIVERAIGGAHYKNKSVHAATKTFQALRIEVNHELDNIKSLMAASLRMLSHDGRMVFISFHSLEDRLVKTFFKNTPELEILTPKPIIASDEEMQLNRSSRSAKLRAARKK